MDFAYYLARYLYSAWRFAAIKFDPLLHPGMRESRREHTPPFAPMSGIRSLIVAAN